MFSIVIPTWNNLPFVKLCVESIQKNSAFNHQIILHINDGRDGTLKWAVSQGIEHTFSPENEGICTAVNKAAMRATNNYIVYMNDDMYTCPNWDKILMDDIGKLGTDNFLLSATMIEPGDTGNLCVLTEDFGSGPANFKESALLRGYARMSKTDWNGSSWPPTVVHKKWWNVVGGYSIEFSPGMSSDDDFSRKMWEAGCRIFKGVGASRVYHFQSKSTGRIIKNNGRRQFLFKWGINQSAFNKYYLKRGSPFAGPLQEPDAKILAKERFRGKLKQWFLIFRDSDE